VSEQLFFLSIYSDELFTLYLEAHCRPVVYHARGSGEFGDGAVPALRPCRPAGVAEVCILSIFLCE